MSCEIPAVKILKLFGIGRNNLEICGKDVSGEFETQERGSDPVEVPKVPLNGR